MNKIIVELKENSYPVLMGSSILNFLRNEIEINNLNRNMLAVIDNNVANYHMDTIKKIFKNLRGRINYYLLRPGETTKSYKYLNKIYSFMLEKGYGRDSLILGIGGGVTGDLVGFAAATFMRGVQLIHIPTTLLAAVDSAIGGKTGINFEKNKNMIGAFYQPKAVVADTGFFRTLPRKEQTSGIGEIIKYGYLADKTFFKYLNENIYSVYDFDEEIVNKIILKCVSIKASVVSQDEKESGIRKILNLGHTFAHGLESELNFKIKHGEAVIAGIVSAIFLSDRLGLLSQGSLDKFLTLPLKIKMPKILSGFDAKNVIHAMSHDKKNRNGKIRFVLPSDIGEMLLDVEADFDAVKYSLLKMKKELFY